MPTRVALCVALSLCAGSARAGEAPAEARATLSLEEVLRLHREIERLQVEKPAAAPIPGSVNRLDLSGRLLPDGIDVSAEAEVSVLADERWVFLPLLKKDEGTHLTGLPAAKDGLLTVRDGWLGFLGSRAGTFALKFSFFLSVQPHPQTQERRGRIQTGATTLAALRLQWDEDLLQLLGVDAKQGPEGLTFFPDRDGFSLRWRPRPQPRRAAPLEAQRVPRESGIPAAWASIVSTLEGQRMVRVLYKLRLGEQKELSVQIPAGMTLEKVFLNGSPHSFAPAPEGEDRVRLPVSPGRQGDETAQLELFLRENPGGFLLSGRLRFALPGISWGVDRLHVRLHLPEVFNYAWSGGSLAPAGDDPLPEFTHAMPTPGKTLDLAQELVGAAPNAEIDYTVDLRGRYYAP